MNPTTRTHQATRLRASLLAVGLITGAAVLGACGGSSAATTSQAATATAPAGSVLGTMPVSGSPILPVSDNPITNLSTVPAMKIDSVLVENNVDAAGKAVTDHLELALTNTGTSPLTAFEVFYTFTDPTTNVTENYYAQLPDTFTIPAGGQRIAHFDNTGATDHFPVSDFSLYFTDTNALDVTVVVSATDTAVQTATVQKDAGGPETAD